MGHFTQVLSFAQTDLGKAAVVDERQDPRIHYLGVVFLSWMEAPGKNYVMGRCLDISAGGVGVELVRRIPTHTEVRVRTGWLDLDCAATVRHIADRGGVFHVGLQWKQPLRADILAGLVGAERS